MPHDVQPEVSVEALARWAAYRPGGDISTELANCFSFGWTGLSEGVELVDNHPLTSGKTVVFVGGHYIFLNFKSQPSCVFLGGAKMAIRASLNLIERDGKKPLMVLGRWANKSDFLVLIKCSLPEYFKDAKVKFSHGVNTFGGKLEVRNGGEFLISLPNMSYVDVFFVDGSVRRLERVGFDLKVIKLSLLEQGLTRLEWAKCSLEELANAKLEDDVLTHRQDAILHQVITVLKFGGQFSEILEAGFEILRGAAEAGWMRRGVKNNALDLLRLVSLPHVLALNEICDRVHSMRMNSGAFGAVSLLSQALNADERKDRDTQRKVREAHRAQLRAHRQEAQTPKGPSGGGGYSHQGDKKRK